MEPGFKIANGKLNVRIKPSPEEIEVLRTGKFNRFVVLHLKETEFQPNRVARVSDFIGYNGAPFQKELDYDYYNSIDADSVEEQITERITALSKEIEPLI